MNKYSKFEAKSFINVVDARSGEKLEELFLANTPWAAYMGAEPVVILDWNSFEKAAPALPLDQEVEFEGRKYTGWWAWGSGAKKRQSYGLTSDFMALRPNRKAVDAQRFGRWMLPHGQYGAVRGAIRVRVVPEGTIVPGHGPIEDGFAVIDQGLFETGYNGRSAVKLGPTADHYMMAQHFDWDLVKDEVLPGMLQRVRNMADLPGLLQQDPNRTSRWDEKARLVAANPEMVRHPFVASAFTNSVKERAFACATSFALHPQYRLAVPCEGTGIGTDGDTIAVRWPIDSFASTSALKAGVPAEEKARIASRLHVQYSVSNVEYHDKGVAAVADLGALGVDMIVCAENIKICPDKRYREPGDHVLGDVVVSLLAVWGKGSAVGVPTAEWKRMGGDYDGDGVVIIDGERFPTLFSEALKFPQDSSFKTKKDKKTGLEGRLEFLVNSMEMGIGKATFIRNATFAFKDRERTAALMGYENAAAMDRETHIVMKIYQDAPKLGLNLDRKRVGAMVWGLSNRVNQVIGGTPAYCLWPRNSWAFAHGVPYLVVDVPDEKFAAGEPEYDTALPIDFDGTVAKIFQIMRPHVEPLITNRVEVLAKGYFLDWAEPQSDRLMAAAARMQFMYAGRVSRVNFTDENSTNQFRDWWAEKCNEWVAESGATRAQCAAALWREAHRGNNLTIAASVFQGFFEEALAIVAGDRGERPVAAVVLGLTNPPARAKWEVKAEPGAVKNGAQETVMAVYQGGVRVGRIAPDSPSPKPGTYTVQIQKRTAKSWTAVFSAAI